MVSHVIYLSRMVFRSIVVAVAVGITTASLLSLKLLPPLPGVKPPTPMIPSPLNIPQVAKGPLEIALISVIAGLIAGLLTMAAHYYYPKYLASRNKLLIEKNMIYILGHMAIMASAGATAEEIFSSLAKMGHLYGIKWLARSVVRDFQLLGKDVFTALDEESQRSPSRELASVLQGFISTARSDGHLGGYLLGIAERYIEDRRRMLSNLISRLSLASELYIGILIVLPTVLLVMLSIMGFLGGGFILGLPPHTLILILCYVLIPAMSAIALILTDLLTAGW